MHGLLGYFFIPSPPPPPKSLGAGYKTGNKTFLVIWGPLNTSRPVACFQHETPTGVQMLPDYYTIGQDFGGYVSPQRNFSLVKRIPNLTVLGNHCC